MSAISIVCQKCHGTGKKPLSQPYQDCMELISRLGSCTIPQLQKRIKGVGPTAVNQRVRRLEKMGLVVVSGGRPQTVCAA